MRAAAVQLSSTPDRDRNLEAADRLTRAAAARGAELVVLPEKWPVLGTPEQTAAGAEPLDGPALELGARRRRASSGIDLVAGSIAERVEGARARREHVACTSGPTARTARSTARSTCSTSRSAAAPTASPSTRRRATRSSRPSSPDGTGLGLTICYDLRFPELYRILAVRGAQVLDRPGRVHARRRRATTGRSCCARGRSRTSASWSPPTRSASTRPGMRSGGRSMIVDPWGARARAGARRRDVRRRRPRPRRGSRRIRAQAARRSPTGRPAAYRWPEEARA